MAAWHRGARFAAGEVGYFPMTRGELHDNDWQHVLAVLVGGGTGAASRAKELFGEQATTVDLFAAANAGDPGAAAWAVRGSGVSRDGDRQYRGIA